MIEKTRTRSVEWLKQRLLISTLGIKQTVNNLIMHSRGVTKITKFD